MMTLVVGVVIVVGVVRVTVGVIAIVGEVLHFVQSFLLTDDPAKPPTDVSSSPRSPAREDDVAE